MEMTIFGWVCILVVGVIALFLVACIAVEPWKKGSKAILIAIIAVIAIAIIAGMFWYYNSTASGQRAVHDEKSDLHNGLYRTVTVYTANGDVIDEFTGFIDLEDNNGGYVLFEFEGKRYTYYNCFVKSVAELD